MGGLFREQPRVIHKPYTIGPLAADIVLPVDPPWLREPVNL